MSKSGQNSVHWNDLACIIFLFFFPKKKHAHTRVFFSGSNDSFKKGSAKKSVHLELQFPLSGPACPVFPACSVFSLFCAFIVSQRTATFCSSRWAQAVNANDDCNEQTNDKQYNQ